MAGRKPIVSARHCKARCQVNLRATDYDVAQNSEMNRLIDMVEAMHQAGVLGDFLLDSLWTKLRQDEGKTVVAYRLVEEGAPPQRPINEQIQYSQQQVPTAPTYAEVPKVLEDVEREPVQGTKETKLIHDQAVGVETRGAGHDADQSSSPSTIIENVVREFESALTVKESNYTETAPTERRKPRGNLLSAMG